MAEVERHGETHPLCEGCWNDLWGGRREPVRVANDRLRRCCACASATWGGIYVRGKDVVTVPGATTALTRCPDLTGGVIDDRWHPFRRSHPLCDTCWARRGDDGKPPRVVGVRAYHCCACGRVTGSGIFVQVGGEPPFKHCPYRM